MPASASIESPDASLSRSTTMVGVYRYQPAGFPRYQNLPNVRAMTIQYREGPDPGVARFRYVFNPADPSTDPTSFEQAMSVDCMLSNVVQNDDRLVVLQFNPDGTSVPLFDGFAQVPELTLSPSEELVTFVAYGIAVREWDTPIGGALMRDADDPTKVDDVETDLPTYFNPRGQPNATPTAADAKNKNNETYATFLDPRVIRSPDLRRQWTLPMAVRHLCFRYNPDEDYAANPDGKLIDVLLDSRSPIAGVTMDPSNPSTYKSEPIIVPDFPATGKPWPVALHALLEPNGFGMVFRLEVDLNGDPYTRLDIFRRQDGSPSTYKDLYLQPAGEALDPSRTNLAQAKLARDVAGVANIYTVSSGPVRYEASFVLAPGFPITTADGADAQAIQAFDLSSPTFSTVNKDKYRLYVFDETGEGHWDFKGATTAHTVAPLNALLGVPSRQNPEPYVKRRRAPSAELFTNDANFKPLRARLSISKNYQGTSPGLWDGSGTWQSVVGGYQLLQDRLAIWMNVPNPNGWNVGLPTAGGMPYPAGIVRGVEDQANPTASHFYLRLTCVIEGDRGLTAVAGRRPSSSTSFGITRRIDGASRYFKQVIAATSEFNTTAQNVIVRDDTEEATAEAAAKRLAGEAGELAGSVTIPRFTDAYRIGDKVRSIVGRGLSLKTNAGAPIDEGDVFPSVVSLTWDFESRQYTTLQLSDHRGAR